VADGAQSEEIIKSQRQIPKHKRSRGGQNLSERLCLERCDDLCKFDALQQLQQYGKRKHDDEQADRGRR